ncbi:MAG: histidine phosphatase family protein [Mycobacterium sp.]
MTEVVRLAFVSHGMTDAMAAGRFPTDEPLNNLGRRQLARPFDLGRIDTVLSGPEQRALQTAELLGVTPEVDRQLADLDYGRWRGDVLSGVQPADLAVWLTDVTSSPHGGESVVALIRRVQGWLDAIGGAHSRVVAVTHPAVVRAAILIALDAPPKSFWRIDVEPASVTTLHFRAQAWTLRLPA